MTNETELAAQVAELQEALAALTRRVQKIEGKLPSDVQAAADWLAYKSAGG
ncbi:hypothetical protein [Mycobacteroides abscessus]|nr:hypothetical protein [Mycobacteroides abscessus]MDM3911602.1 hypothetical protein [Mycobacteroides abscessus]MDM3916104.1 hypothetical protein [Mycobacteroides abscessus]MDM3938610.1 hypothetical protein [Mycobacteroides abscessus]